MQSEQIQNFSEASATISATSASELQHLKKEIAELRNQISDLAMQVDAYKARKGGAAGGAVFLLLLAVMAGYDLMNGKAGLWAMVGITAELLKFLVVAFVVVGLVLLAFVWFSGRRRGNLPEMKLAELEDELERLLIRQSALETN